jgi:hypothetical protein
MKDSLRKLPAVLATLLTVALPAAAATVPGDRDPHDGIACSKCHLGSAARALAVADDGAADPRSATCRECHSHPARRASAGATALGFHDSPRADCAGCHAFHERGRLKTSVGDVRTGDGLAQATAGHCAGCHAEGADLLNLSDAHRIAAALYHRDAGELAGQSPSQGCLNCHAAGSASPWLRETGTQRLTFNLHATHPLGVSVVAGSGQDERRLRADLDPRLRLFDGKIECQTCHQLTAQTADLLVPFAESYDLCLGCHQLRNPRPSDQRRAVMATMVPLP